MSSDLTAEDHVWLPAGARVSEGLRGLSDVPWCECPAVAHEPWPKYAPEWLVKTHPDGRPIYPATWSETFEKITTTFCRDCEGVCGISGVSERETYPALSGPDVE